jgi:hypothetical protein
VILGRWAEGVKQDFGFDTPTERRYAPAPLVQESAQAPNLPQSCCAKAETDFRGNVPTRCLHRTAGS